MRTHGDYWFPRKRFGWGWGFPIRWQGWVVMAAFVALIGVETFLIQPTQRPMAFVACVLVTNLLLVAVCWAKGEPARWQWGSDGRP